MRRAIAVFTVCLLLVSAFFPEIPAARERMEIAGKVLAGETDYEIPIEVVNRKGEDITSVVVRVESHPSELVNFRIDPSAVDEIPDGESAGFYARFDVAEDAESREYAEIIFSVAAADTFFDNPRPGLAVAIVGAADEEEDDGSESDEGDEGEGGREYYIIRVSGGGFIPHWSNGSYIKDGFKDIPVSVDLDTGETFADALERVRADWNKPPNCEYTISDRLALSEGPPRFWTSGPEVEKKIGPLTAEEMDREVSGDNWETVADDGPNFCALMERFCGYSCDNPNPPDDDTGTSGSTGAPEGPEGEASGPVDPNSLDPDTQPEVAAKIREWLSIAQPPPNAVPGNHYYYDRFGRMLGAGAGMATIGQHDTVEYGVGPSPEKKVWDELRRGLDSVNHCTLEEYVVARLQGGSIAYCRGRYGAMRDLKGEPLDSARSEAEGAGFEVTVSTGSAASSPESAGTVETQKPGPTQYMKKGQRFGLVVYGPFVEPRIAVPRVVDEPIDDGAALLEGKGFEVERVEVENLASPDKNFLIVRQDPREGTELERGGTVRLSYLGTYTFVRETTAALDACDPEEAAGYLARMPAGAEKQRLQARYRELDAVLQTAKESLARAKTMAAEDCHEEALAALAEISLPPPCDEKQRKIEDLAAGFEGERARLRGKVTPLTARAEEAYRGGCFDEALGLLTEARELLRCESQIERLNGLVGRVTAERDRTAAGVNAQANEAQRLYQEGCYEDARKIMDDVKREVRCGDKIAKIDALIGRIDNSREELERLSQRALQAYEAGCLDEAERVLAEVRAKVSCRKLVTEMDEFAAKVQRRRTELNERMSEAARAFEQGCHDDAIAVLNDVLGNVSCPPARERISGLMAQARQKKSTLQGQLGRAKASYDAGDRDGAIRGLEGILGQQLCPDQRAKVEDLLGRIRTAVVTKPIPRVTGMKIDAAVNALRNAGFRETINRDLEPSSPSQSLLVYDQSPAAGTAAVRGATVRIAAYSEYVPPAGGQVDGGERMTAGNWQGLARLSVDTRQGINSLVYNLNFSVNSAGGARGIMSYQDEVTNLAGEVRGGRITMSAREEYGSLSLVGSLRGNRGEGSFEIYTDDIACVVEEMMSPSGRQCGKATYKGSWSATRQ